MRKTYSTIGALFLFIASPLFFMSCEDKIDVLPVEEDDQVIVTTPVNTNPTPVQTEFESIEDFLDDLKPEPQIFTFDPTVENEIIGEDGTVFVFPANSILDANGNPYTGLVEMNLTELMDPLSVILAGRPTFSNGAALLSAGSFNLSLTTPSGEPLSSTGYSSSIENENGGEMNVYRGEIKADGSFDWVEVTDCDITYSQPTQSFNTNIDFTGWINIDLDLMTAVGLPGIVIRCNLIDTNLTYPVNIDDLCGVLNFENRFSVVNFSKENDSTFFSPLVPISQEATIRCFGLGTDKGFVYSKRELTTDQDTLIYDIYLESITSDSLKIELDSLAL